MPQAATIDELTTRLVLKERELEALLQITQAVTDDRAEGELYKIYQFTLLGQLGIRQLALYVLEEQAFRLKASSFGTRLPADSRFRPEEVATWCPRVACPLKELPLGEPWQQFEQLVPIRGENETVQALLFTGATQSRAGLTVADSLAFLVTLSNILLGAVANRRLVRQRMASLAAESARQREIEIAQQVQLLLFPQRLPNNERVALYATYRPHAEIGGDYYDVVELDADRLLVCVADVSGKGVPASLLMSNFQAGLRTLLRQGIDLATTVRELNHLIFRNSAGEKFITAFLALYDRRTQVLEYVNAGHNDPLLLPDAGPPQRLHDGTLMLGVMDELPMLKVGLAHMAPHSLLFTYTDGLTEVFDQQHQEFGEAGVLAVLQAHRYLPLPRLHHELLAAIQRFNRKGDRFADDVTMLSLRVK
ncbi:PP2C family protein-serine/threonine phosphatase [Hymenobacter sp. RP-2-7]|uniref:PP2C family protein-serine/threonine phosphatase n=1 Tax=Hymenobacter polaris TaxID=2682546 RepID=A0A7Y0FM32_9BACT|nr:PP2C family protein-serine/threonine phosphatase [Hymenobacter polaris]NML65071.1 PP2C family protein-serine/threonine phosphatase [Hymenobacter polaris]